jgi:hypothetical protein
VGIHTKINQSQNADSRKKLAIVILSAGNSGTRPGLVCGFNRADSYFQATKTAKKAKSINWK